MHVTDPEADDKITEDLMSLKADLSDARHGTELRSFPGVHGPDQ